MRLLGCFRSDCPLQGIFSSVKKHLKIQISEDSWDGAVPQSAPELHIAIVVTVEIGCHFKFKLFCEVQHRILN